MKKLSLEGARFGKLTVIQKSENAFSPSRTHTTWLCSCDCGTELVVRTSSLRSGITKSCGCYKTETLKARAGLASKYPREYSSWCHMKSRCKNPDNKDYPDYGARGIDVCDEWLESFDSFIRDMGVKPSINHSIDRIDNEKGYCKDNCRWATDWQQSRNKRSNIIIEFNGEAMILQDWADRIGISWVTLYERLQKHPIEKALTSKKGEMHVS